MSWLFARVDRILTEEVPAPPAQVRGCYTDLDNIALVHPLVVSVRVTHRVDAADGYRQTYRVRDRIPLGHVSLPISYVARMHVPADGAVISEARQFPRVRLRATVTFEPIGVDTRVTERLRIEAPRPLASVTVREAVKSHIAMWTAIRHLFE